MAGAFDNIHPGLSQEEAIRLLTAPIDELESQSDPYMAAAHLINFPGDDTESALLTLVQGTDQSQPRRLARRKAVEVLGRLGCVDATTAIGDCLNSDDPYLVENAAFALQLLKCRIPEIHARMIQLLPDPSQNQRVLIQSLAALDVQDARPVIQQLQDAEQSGVRGAAISAGVRLGGPRDRLSALEPLMLRPNQMDRQTAIQDAINAGGRELLPQILRAPVSPVFRMRAVRALWPDGAQHCNDLKLTDVLDALLHDSPQSLELVHAYDQEPTDGFLIQEFFGTDFGRSYLALNHFSIGLLNSSGPCLSSAGMRRPITITAPTISSFVCSERSALGPRLPSPDPKPPGGGDQHTAPSVHEIQACSGARNGSTGNDRSSRLFRGLA